MGAPNAPNIDTPNRTRRPTGYPRNTTAECGPAEREDTMDVDARNFQVALADSLDGELKVSQGDLNENEGHDFTFAGTTRTAPRRSSES